MTDFVRTIGELCGYLLLIGGFILYLTFEQTFHELTAVAVVAAASLSVITGSTFSVSRYRRTKAEERAGEGERPYVRWSAQSELQYDLIGWLTFLGIVVLGVWADGGLTVTDLIQGVLALIAFSFGKRLFLSRS